MADNKMLNETYNTIQYIYVDQW